MICYFKSVKGCSQLKNYIEFKTNFLESKITYDFWLKKIYLINSNNVLYEVFLNNKKQIIQHTHTTERTFTQQSTVIWTTT